MKLTSSQTATLKSQSKNRLAIDNDLRNIEQFNFFYHNKFMIINKYSKNKKISPAMYVNYSHDQKFNLILVKMLILIFDGTLVCTLQTPSQGNFCQNN